MNRSRKFISAGTIAAVALLGACGDGDNNAETISAPGVSLSVDQPSDGEETDDTAEVNGSEATTVSEREKEVRRSETQSAGPVASKEFTTTNAEARSIPVRVDVMALERDAGDVVRLELRITNRHDDANWRPTHTFSATPELDLSGVSLIDLQNDLRYLVLIDSDEACVCSSVSSTLSAGEHIEVQASFPAPPPDVTEVDVQLGDLGVIGAVAVSDR